LFNNKRRVDAAFAKGLMFGKAVGKRDERDRIVKLLEDDQKAHAYPNDVCGCEYEKSTLDTIGLIRGESND